MPQIDAKKRKTFLKRTHCEGLGSSSSPLRPNSFVMVMARRLQILSPADSSTRDKLSENTVTRCNTTHPAMHIRHAVDACKVVHKL